MPARPRNVSAIGLRAALDLPGESLGTDIGCEPHTRRVERSRAAFRKGQSENMVAGDDEPVRRTRCEAASRKKSPRPHRCGPSAKSKSCRRSGALNRAVRETRAPDWEARIERGRVRRYLVGVVWNRQRQRRESWERDHGPTAARRARSEYPSWFGGRRGEVMPVDIWKPRKIEAVPRGKCGLRVHPKKLQPAGGSRSSGQRQTALGVLPKLPMKQVWVNAIQARLGSGMGPALKARSRGGINARRSRLGVARQLLRGTTSAAARLREGGDQGGAKNGRSRGASANGPSAMREGKLAMKYSRAGIPDRLSDGRRLRPGRNRKRPFFRLRLSSRSQMSEHWVQPSPAGDRSPKEGSDAQNPLSGPPYCSRGAGLLAQTPLSSTATKPRETTTARLHAGPWAEPRANVSYPATDVAGRVDRRR